MLKGLRGICSMNINMVEQNCWDDIPIGPIVDEDFENLLNSLDFPLESLEDDGGLGGDWDPSLYQLLGPIPADALMALPPVSRGDNANDCLNAANEFPEAQGTVLFQTHSPISVLEHNSSCSGGKSRSSNFGTKGRRSKRARSSTLNPWILMAPTSCRAFAAKKNSDAQKGKEKKRRKLSQQSSVMDSSLFKKCTHCEVTRTPQWREGPLGPKTLCNACGVRYRSGRLLPEYRPAASPTFVPSLHSNSHRKVIEMRRNAVEESQGDVLETKRSFSNVTEPKICSSEYLFV